MADKPTVEEAISSFSEKEMGDIKVLMIEDDAFLSELVLTKLSQFGCIPYSTGNGEEGVELAAQYQPDVIILDLMLPGKSGEEILLELKSKEELKKIPVIVFSNKSNEEDIEKNLKNGAAKYLVKSATDLKDLPGIVTQVVNK